MSTHPEQGLRYVLREPMPSEGTQRLATLPSGSRVHLVLHSKAVRMWAQSAPSQLCRPSTPRDLRPKSLCLSEPPNPFLGLGERGSCLRRLGVLGDGGGVQSHQLKQRGQLRWP